MRIVALEANVGAGKTSLLKPLASELTMWSCEPWTVIAEPVDEDKEFTALLEDALADPNDPSKRIKFQKYITNQRQNLLKGLPDGNYLIERSLFSDIVFSQTYMLISEQPSGEYLSYYYDIKNRLKDYPKIDLIVYLDREPESCLQSIINRGRKGENYTIDTLSDIKRFHDACLPQIAKQYNTRMVTVNLGKDYPLPSVVVCDIMGAIYD